MNLGDVDLIKLQAAGLREDPTIRALCDGLTPEVKKIAAAIRLLLLFGNIDEQPEAVLDELAYELKIDWYLNDASIDVKRSLVKNSDRVHQSLGTPFTIEQVVQDYFGVAVVSEWFDYAGEPGYFRISTNARITSEPDFMRFVKILNIVKRCSAHLEFLELLRNSSGTLGIADGGVRQHVRVFSPLGGQIGG